MTLTSFIFVSFWLEESPLFLYNKGLYAKAKSSLRKMARFNGLDIEEDFMFDKEEEQLNLVQ